MSHRSIQCSALEARLLFSADGPLALMLPPAAVTQASDAGWEAPVDGIDTPNRELVVVDSAVHDWQTLAADLRTRWERGEVELLMLNDAEDGVAQVQQRLADMEDVSAIHLVTHGSDGQFWLGDSRLANDTLADFAAELVAWQDALAPDADILIYGCNVAQHADGRILIESLAELTGADIAASTNLTGHAALGGDWQFEYHVGPIDTGVVFGHAAQQEWLGLLAALTAYEPFDYAAGPGGLNGQNGGTGWAGGWSAVGTDTTVVATSLTESSSSLATQGGAAQFSTTGVSNVTQTRSLSTTLGADGTTTWFSFLLEPNWMGPLDFAGLQFGTSPVMVGYKGINYFMENAGGGGTVNTSITAWSGQPSLLVVKAEFMAGNDRLTLYVNPTPGQATPDTPAAAVKTDRDLGSFSVIGIAGGLGLNDAKLDEIRIGASFADVTPVANATPVITSNGGGATAAVGVAENSTFVTTVTATDSDLPPQTLTYGISGGTDASRFTMDATTGALSFLAAPDFELPTDSDGNNIYEVTVEVSDDLGATDTQQIQVTVTNVAEQHVIVVDTTSDYNTGDARYGDTTSLATLLADRGTDGLISLREAIEAANNTTNDGFLDEIHFNIATPLVNGAHTIQVIGPLPEITDPVVIDGTTEPDYSGTPIIELDGQSATGGANGLEISGGGSTIRGLVINRFADRGIYLHDLGGNTIEHNYIGTDVTGMVGLGNVTNGIQINDSNDNLIGGTTAAQRNVISGNGEEGIEILSGATGNRLQGNYIGTNATGTGALGNSFHGIVLRQNATDNSIGGILPGEGNIIAFNAGSGVAVTQNGTDRVAIRGNRIFANGGLGIDLNDDGVTPNDLGDPDNNENNLQNFPVLSAAATSSGDLTISGTLNSIAGSTFWVDFYASAIADSSGHGEAERYLGSATVTTDAGGNVTFNEIFSGAGVSANEFVTATATDASGNTSEFAANVTAVGPNSVPVANAGGPYAMDEGTTVMLDASLSMDADGDTLTYAWDLDNDGNYGEIGEPVTTSATVSVAWTTLQSFGIDDDGSYTIALRVQDGNGGVHVDSATLTVGNVAPNLSVSGPSSVASGASYTLALNATDPGDDTISGWTINWGDGSIEQIAGNPSTVSHIYQLSGFTYNISASATDEDGTFHDNDLLVTGDRSDSVFRYAATTGSFAQIFADSNGLVTPYEVAFGPDGHIYISGQGSDNVLRYNGSTLAFMDEFVASNSGGLSTAKGMAFGPDGHLYVASYDTNEVLRYDGSNGSFLGAFVTAGLGGLSGPGDLLFGPDGNLYVGGSLSHNVLRYDALTGAVVDEFVAAWDGGLNRPLGMAFGPDGHLYIADAPNDRILQFDGSNGGYRSDFVFSGNGGLNYATGVTFGPDGDLYVSSFDSDEVLRFDGATGLYRGTHVTVGSGGLDGPVLSTFIPSQQVFVSNASPIANAGGPYVISEGVQLNLDGSGSVDPNGHTLTFAWDLNGDGTYGGAGEPTTATSSVNWTTLLGLGISNGSYVIGLRVDNGQGGVDTTTATVTVVNTAPVITSPVTVSLLENTTFVQTVTAIDPADPVTFTITGGADQSAFVMNSTTGTLSFATAPDFETPADTGNDNVYEVEVTAADGDGGTDIRTISVNILNVNDNTPVISSGQTFAISELAANGTLLGSVTASDADAGTLFSNWQITGGNAAGVFAINGTTGALTVANNANLDFETTTSYSLSVTVSDGVNTSAAGIVTVNVTNANDNTPVIPPGQTFTVSELAANGTLLGSVTASDADAGTLFSNWQITGGNAAGVFAINGTTGALTVANNVNLDFETTTSYSLSITVSDGVNTSAAGIVTVNVTNANDNTPVIPPGQTFTVSELAANGTLLGSVTASDADAGTLFSNWQITGGNAAGVFAINGTTGALTVANNANLDFETTTSYSLSITVSDGVNTSAAGIVTVNVTNANDNTPVIPPGQTFTVSELAANGTLPAGESVTASDADAGTFSVTGRLRAATPRACSRSTARPARSRSPTTRTWTLKPRPATR